MEPWSIVLVALLAILVGAALPVLFQMYAALRSTRQWMDQVGPRVAGTLDEVRSATERLNHAVSGVEQNARRVRSVVQAVGDLGRTFRQARLSLRTATALGAALGPALAAGMRALVEPRGTRRSPGASAETPPATKPEPDAPGTPTEGDAKNEQ